MTEHFTYKGFKFTCEIEPDRDATPPWEAGDCNGIVFGRVTPHNKRPGNRLLHKSHGHVWVYDMEATRLKAKEQHWGLPPEEAKGLTKKQILAAAVEKDFQRMHGWLNDKWWYVGVIVSIDEEGLEYDSSSVWHVESDCEDFIKECRDDLAENLLPDRFHVEARCAAQDVSESGDAGVG